MDETQTHVESNRYVNLLLRPRYKTILPVV